MKKFVTFAHFFKIILLKTLIVGTHILGNKMFLPGSSVIIKMTTATEIT